VPPGPRMPHRPAATRSRRPSGHGHPQRQRRTKAEPLDQPGVACRWAGHPSPAIRARCCRPRHSTARTGRCPARGRRRHVRQRRRGDAHGAAERRVPAANEAQHSDGAHQPTRERARRTCRRRSPRRIGAPASLPGRSPATAARIVTARSPPRIAQPASSRSSPCSRTSAWPTTPGTPRGPRGSTRVDPPAPTRSRSSGARCGGRGDPDSHACRCCRRAPARLRGAPDGGALLRGPSRSSLIGIPLRSWIGPGNQY
jgi:hypothetical protein